MNRRKFFGLMVGGIVASAAVRAFPFRVYSFPTQVAQPDEMAFLTREALRKVINQLKDCQPYKGQDFVAYVHPLAYEQQRLACPELNWPPLASLEQELVLA